MKLAASATVAAAWQFGVPWAAAAETGYVSFAGLLWRAGGAGKVETSSDAGQTWTPHSDLGDKYSIRRLVVTRYNRLRLTVGYAGSTFPLVLAKDKRSWLLRA
jgi:hypothetical protein